MVGSIGKRSIRVGIYFDHVLIVVVCVSISRGRISVVVEAVKEAFDVVAEIVQR